MFGISKTFCCRISDILQKQGAVYQAIAGVDHWYIGLTDFGTFCLEQDQKDL